MSRTSEWVSPGHSDKIADNISEYILDRYLEKDSNVRYALEVMIKNNNVYLGGEVTSKYNFTLEDLEHFVKNAIRKIGYDEKYYEKWGDYAININKINITNDSHIQSPDISQGVDNSGWGDQGIFWGFAENNKYTNYMPLDHYLAKDLGMILYNNAKENGVGGLDIKTQITLNNDNEVEQVIVAIPVLDDNEYQEVVKSVHNWLLKENVDLIEFIENNKLVINGTGIYQYHSSVGDCGITGRKLVVDFYGGNSKIGGGCVDSETEYMSESGWKKIKDYDGGKVGQITNSLELQIVEPIQYIETFHDNVYEISTEKTTNMVLSDNHNVLYITSKGHLNKKPLFQILEESNNTKYGSHINIPVTFTYDFKNGQESSYNDIIAKIVIAHCADGTILKDGSKKFNSRIRVKKDYKIQQLQELFTQSHIDWEKRVYKDGYTYFYYNLKNTSKLLCEQFENPNYHTAHLIANEVFKWDGSTKEKCFRTKIEKDADFVQFILSSVNGKFYSKLKNKTNGCFIIREVNKKVTSPFRKKKTNNIVKLEPQQMYCFTVPSGMLLLRRNGYIYCTGNSPWTKDGTKADLTLNLYMRDLAKQYICTKFSDCKYVETSACCCIGKSEIFVTIKGYDCYNNFQWYEEYKENISPKELIEKYNLNKSNFSDMCMNGLFNKI